MGIARTTPDVLLLNIRGQLAANMGWKPGPPQLPSALIWPLERLYIATLEVPAMNVQGDQYLTIRMMGLEPVESAIHGAGRLDFRTKMPVTITISSRLNLDDIAQQVAWLTDASLGNIRFETAIINALSLYWPTDANGNGLCYEPLILRRGNVPEIDKQMTGWGQSALTFSIDYVQDMDQSVQ